MQGEERMICHFYRDNWPCKVSGVIEARLQVGISAQVLLYDIVHHGDVLQGNNACWQASTHVPALANNFAASHSALKRALASRR
eukprot:200464-Pelagomonas_calceolata.AAC.5